MTRSLTPCCFSQIVSFVDRRNTDPVVRMYVNQMIAQGPTGKPYSKRHLESVEQMLRLINEVLTIAPEFGSAMVATPLGAIVEHADDSRRLGLLLNRELFKADAQFICKALQPPSPAVTRTDHGGVD